MPWTTSDKVMQLRERHVAIDVLVDTLDGWRRHISGRNASVLAFFGFLSIFPLMLAATTILGFVLENNPDLQQEIIDGALADRGNSVRKGIDRFGRHQLHAWERCDDGPRSR